MADSLNRRRRAQVMALNPSQLRRFKTDYYAHIRREAQLTHTYAAAMRHLVPKRQSGNESWAFYVFADRMFDFVVTGQIYKVDDLDLRDMRQLLKVNQAARSFLRTHLNDLVPPQGRPTALGRLDNKEPS